MGEFSQFTLIPMATAALTQVVEWGVEEIAEGIGGLTGQIAAESSALGCEVPRDDARVRHMLGVRLPGGVQPGLTERLAADKVYVSVRGDSIRVAPHLYNDERDVERFVGVLKSALG
jgi:selenocysteine lyase/cysteine desulfurase